jgi:glycine betaine/proline transport system substrate-binding protein
MTKTKRFSLLFALVLQSTVILAQAPKCRVVRMADIGWTDVTITTAMAKEILEALGYSVEISVLSTPVALAGIKNNDIDVFLGNWMPTQEADIRHYLDEGSVIQLNQNLKGAVFTLAVPQYVYDEGVESFSELEKFADKFQRVIYGIEPGNDGNRLILQMIKDDAYGLRNWRLIESSEQGMMVAVKNAINHKKFIVFLGWAPHPMNVNMKMKYLSGGENYFGPNLGASRIFTVARKGLPKDCVNVANFFRNLTFSIELENQLMDLVLNEHMSPRAAVQSWLVKNKDTASTWIDGVTTFNGRSAQQALNKYISSKKNPDKKIKNTRAPIGRLMEQGVSFLTENFATYFRTVSDGIEHVVNFTVLLMLKPHWGFIIGLFGLLVFIFHRSFRLLLAVTLGLLLIVNLGLWTETVKTLVLVMFASMASIAFGVPFGIVATRRPWFYATLRPVLDLMQTIPTFVYLIPTLMLFGLGVAPGLISTIVFSIAAPIRLTHLGLKNVPKDLVEASQAFGASRLQTLLKVEIPHAMPSILAGFTQCIMLSLSMVVIAALVGADGLGTPVVRALNTVNIVQGFEAGIAIVILAILLDRTLSVKGKRIKIRIKKK